MYYKNYTIYSIIYALITMFQRAVCDQVQTGCGYSLFPIQKKKKSWKPVRQFITLRGYLAFHFA
jgi:hypothetical protein